MTYFLVTVLFILLQRLHELRLAKRNTDALLRRGAIEIGGDHYWMLVSLHTLFFLSLVGEYVARRPGLPTAWPIYFSLFMLAQIGRVWVIRTMRGRWTTRILFLPGETLIASGPFKYLPHPNYTVVAIELFSVPMTFNLYLTAAFFTVLNAVVLLAVRIPRERAALEKCRPGLEPAAITSGLRRA